MDFYGGDLAYIHDVGFSDFARGAAPALLALLRRQGVTEGLAVDLGCGGGIWMAELQRAGFSTLGIDISPTMIEVARHRVPEARFQCCSLTRARLPVCEVVTSLGECLNYQPQGHRATSLSKIFEKVWHALRPGGVLIFDLAEPGRGAVRQLHVEGSDWVVLVDVEEDTKTRRLTRRITSFRQVGQLYRKSTESHQLLLHRRADALAELRRLGFRARTLFSYGAQRLPLGCVAFVARKPR